MTDMMDIHPVDDAFSGLKSNHDRRRFIRSAALMGTALGFGAVDIPVAHASDDSRFRKEAKYYEKMPDGSVACRLCPKECVVDKGGRGHCGVRENTNGTYYTLVHSRPCSLHVDPIEKKPLFHFHPSSLAFSIATAGCNVDCKFCQNWDISQALPEEIRSIYATPETVAREAKRSGSVCVAYTYSEPVIFYEYMSDCADAGHALGVKSVMISNGFINPKPLKELTGHLDAIKIDFKAFTNKFYREIVNGELKPVLDNLVLIKSTGTWLEIVNLVIPTLNDTRKEFEDMAGWIMKNLGPDVPVHFSRFHGMYKLKHLPTTPLKSLNMARDICLDKGLHFVYLGNVRHSEAEDTFCMNCKKHIIKRVGYNIREIKIKNGNCEYCGQKIPGVWDNV